MANKKNKKQRDQTKYPNFTRKLYSRAKQEYFDYSPEFIASLNEEEKEFLHKFLGETLNAGFEGDETDLHQDPDVKKEIYGENNARNRCLYGQLKTKVRNTKLLNYDLVKNLVEEELSRGINTDHIEDSLINYIDSTRESSEDPQSDQE